MTFLDRGRRTRQTGIEAPAGTPVGTRVVVGGAGRGNALGDSATNLARMAAKSETKVVLEARLTVQNQIGSAAVAVCRC